MASAGLSARFSTNSTGRAPALGGSGSVTHSSESYTCMTNVRQAVEEGKSRKCSRVKTNMWSSTFARIQSGQAVSGVFKVLLYYPTSKANKLCGTNWCLRS